LRVKTLQQSLKASNYVKLNVEDIGKVKSDLI